MSAGIITVIIVIAAVVAVAVAAGVVYDSRRRRLRQRFGPEYDRLVAERDNRLKAEAELTEREKRVRGLDIRPLAPEAQARYAGEWAAIQERFVDAPQQSVTEAQRLVMAVLGERGYPTEGTGQVLADLSVEHARTLDHYRSACEISQRAGDGLASTEDLRQAMIHYRALFQDLLGPVSPAGVTEPVPEDLVQPIPGPGAVIAPEADAAEPDPELMVPGQRTATPGRDSGVTES